MKLFDRFDLSVLASAKVHWSSKKKLDMSENVGILSGKVIFLEKKTFDQKDLTAITIVLIHSTDFYRRWKSIVPNFFCKFWIRGQRGTFFSFNLFYYHFTQISYLHSNLTLNQIDFQVQVFSSICKSFFLRKYLKGLPNFYTNICPRFLINFCRSNKKKHFQSGFINKQYKSTQFVTLIIFN